MKILILHRIPYQKIDYHRGIDHNNHDVFYYGYSDILDTIPKELTCIKLKRKNDLNLETEVIKIIEEKDIKLDLVISLSEYELLSAAIIREHFNINGISIEQTLKVRDKLIMKECVSNSNIRVPKNMSLSSFMKKENIEISGKIVLKPIDGASSENVNIYENYRELKQVCFDKKTGIKEIDNSDWKNYQVEEFISGEIMHFDGLVLNGNIQILLASQYLGDCLSFVKGKPLGSYQIETTYKHYEWVNSVLNATDLKNGSFHVEAFNSGNELIFLELANRVGGADVVNTFELATGVHLPSEELKIYLNEKPNISNNKITKKYGWFVFPGHHYDYDFCQIKGTERFRNLSQVVHFNELTKQTRLKKSITYHANEVPLSGIVKDNSSFKLCNLMQDIFNSVEIKKVKEGYINE